MKINKNRKWKEKKTEKKGQWNTSTVYTVCTLLVLLFGSASAHVYKQLARLEIQRSLKCYS